MFDIQYILNSLSGRHSSEVLNKTIQDMVNRGLLEQYTDEDGDFKFQLTDLGLAIGENMVDDPTSLFDLDEDDDDMV